MKEWFDLEDKVAVVVGGATGIGRAIALGYARAGAHVVASSRRRQQVEETAHEIVVLGRKTLRLTWLSRPGESHPQPLQEPDVNLSAHPAPITQATKWLCYFQGLLLPSSWPLVWSRVTKPLRSAAITTASSLLRACPPLGNASILSASQVLCLCLSLSIVAPSSRSST